MPKIKSVDGRKLDACIAREPRLVDRREEHDTLLSDIRLEPGNRIIESIKTFDLHDAVAGGCSGGADIISGRDNPIAVTIARAQIATLRRFNIGSSDAAINSRGARVILHAAGWRSSAPN